MRTQFADRVSWDYARETEAQARGYDDAWADKHENPYADARLADCWQWGRQCALNDGAARQWSRD